MNTQLLVAACCTIGLLGTWNAWTLHQITERLDRIEATMDSPRAVSSGNASVKGRSSYRSTSYSEKAEVPTASDSTRVSAPASFKSTPAESAIDLSDPDIRDAIAQIAQADAQKKEVKRRESKMEAYKTSVRHELEKFATEKGYDEDTTKQIEVILDESSDEWSAVRQQVRDGEISWIDARTEFKAIGDDTQSKVTEVISDEDYQELRSKLWGRWD